MAYCFHSKPDGEGGRNRREITVASGARVRLSNPAMLARWVRLSALQKQFTTLRSGGANLVFTGYDKDRDLAAPDDFFGYAAKDDMFYSRSSVCADYEDIDFFLLSKLEYFIIFTPRFGNDFNFNLFLDMFQIFIIEHLFTIFRRIAVISSNLFLVK